MLNCLLLAHESDLLDPIRSSASLSYPVWIPLARNPLFTTRKCDSLSLSSMQTTNTMPRVVLF